MDFDPRDSDPRDADPRDHERDSHERRRDSSGSSHTPDRDDDWRQPHSSDRDDAREPGRGGGDDSRHTDAKKDGDDPRNEARWGERDWGGRDRGPQDVFARHVDLPRGLEREVVRYRDHEYRLRGSESRTLATVGAFRVVSSRDLRDGHDRPLDPRSGDLRHLREQRLVETVRLPGSRDHAVTLTKTGHGLLERYRDDGGGTRQAFYDGLIRAREREHDVQVYRAYEQEAARLAEEGARIDRVVLDHELKSEYQRWLHDRDRERDDYDGHPDRSPGEIQDWAAEHDLPYFDDQVHFPDVRIEYRDIDDREDQRDLEVTTEHYRGAHRAGVGRSGFTCYRGGGGRMGGGGGGGGGRTARGGHVPRPGLAEEFLK